MAAATGVPAVSPAVRRLQVTGLELGLELDLNLDLKLDLDGSLR